MRCLHTLLHCHVGRIPTVQLVDHLETFLQKVFDFDVAQPQNSTRVPLDSGILRMLWLNMEQRAPVYEGFDGLLQRALDIIRPDHPYMGSELAQGMPDAAAILTRLGSKEIAYHRFVAGSEAKAKAVEDRLKDTLLKVNLRFQPSRQEEKDKFRAVRLAMSRSRAAGVDWTGFFEQQS